MPHLEAPLPEEIAAARLRIAGSAIRTPLVRLDLDLPFDLWLKLESLQPIGSFKLRGALNAIRALPPNALADGVYTASAGNMAQGVAWGARELGVRCTVLVPEQAPRTKLDAIARLGADVVKLPYEEWWNVLVEHGRQGMKGEFIHPVSNSAVLAGNATIGVEIIEDLPTEPAAVFIPYGGGGLATGIAAAVKHLAPATRVYACEVETAAPFSASRRAGRPMTIDHTASFVDGIGGRSVLAEMWPIASALLDESLVMSVAAIADAVRTLAIRAHLVVEGAGATAVAAAIDAGRRLVPARAACVAVVSGGNIDSGVLIDILGGKL
jgi:threonine dehydratase